MKISVITPYYKETTEQLLSMHRSVLRQDMKVTHVMVADGFPNASVSKWDCQHIILPTAHHDAGNFARGVGALHAFQSGADCVCYLDADNWLESGHVSSLFDAMSESKADVAVSRRALRRLDGSILEALDSESDAVRFADTSTMMLARSAIEISTLWITMPQQLSGAGDQIVWAAINQRGLKVARTGIPTMNYVTKWDVHYSGRGEVAPQGAVDLGIVRASEEFWKAMPEIDRRRLILGHG